MADDGESLRRVHQATGQKEAAAGGAECAPSG
jgi:hypothetical protein